MKKCKMCEFPIAQNLEELNEGVLLEERDGLCFDCWILTR